jgi:Ras-related protein Rab-28
MDSSGPAIEGAEPEHMQFKVIILGDGAVGKTSLCMRFTEDSFAKSYKQTIGLDFYLKQLTLPGNKQVAIQLWDIGGQTIGSKMVSNYIYGAHALLLTYDITNYQSFQDLEDWFALVQKVYTKENMPRLALIANKSDLTHLRAVKPDKHNVFADQHGMYSYFVSAKTGDNVAATMFRIAADLAGVVLSKPDIEVASKVVTAQIVNHPQDSAAATGQNNKDASESKCAVM